MLKCLFFTHSFIRLSNIHLSFMLLFLKWIRLLRWTTNRKSVHILVVQHVNGPGSACPGTTHRCPSVHSSANQLHSPRDSCFLFFAKHASKVWAVSRSNDRREPSVLHHCRNWTKPPGRHWDCQENDQNGKGNKLDTCGFILNVNKLAFHFLYQHTRAGMIVLRTQFKNVPI